MQLVALFDRYASSIALALLVLTLAARAYVAIFAPPHPRLRAAVEALGALSPDPVRTIAQVYEAVTGRRIAPVWMLLGDLLRPPASAASSGSADPGERATFAPGDLPERRIDETTRSMRARSPGARGAVSLALALLVGVAGGCATTSNRPGEPTAEARVAATATTVLTSAALVRQLVCAPELVASLGDPTAPAAVARRYLCDPLVGALLDVAPLLVPRSSGGDGPSSAPAPAPAPPPAVAPPPTAATPSPAPDPGGPS